MQGGIFLWKKKGIKYGKNRETKSKKDNLILTNGTVLFCYSQSSRMEEKCMSSTALGAEKAIIFISDAHEKFYYEKLKEVRYQDVYH